MTRMLFFLTVVLLKEVEVRSRMAFLGAKGLRRDLGHMPRPTLGGARFPFP